MQIPDGQLKNDRKPALYEDNASDRFSKTLIFHASLAEKKDLHQTIIIVFNKIFLGGIFYG
jgi:hypothetical protein